MFLPTFANPDQGRPGAPLRNSSSTYKTSPSCIHNLNGNLITSAKKWTYLYAYPPRVVFKSVRALTSHISLDTTTAFKGGLFLQAKSSDTHTRRERTHLYDGRHLGNTPSKMSSWQTRWPTFILSGCMRVCVCILGLFPDNATR